MARLFYDAARRATTLVTQENDANVQRAERDAEDIRREAEREAHATRRDAVESARRVLDRIDELERPLGQLVMALREEVDRVLGEIEPPVDADSITLPPAEDHGLAKGRVDPSTPEPAYAAPSADPPRVPQDPSSERRSDPPPEAESSARRDDLAPAGKSTASTPREEDRQGPLSVAAENSAQGPAGVRPVILGPESAAEPRRETRGIFSRLRARSEDRKGAFIKTEGNCAVCQKPFTAGSEENLRVSGWRVSGEVGLCPDCQNDRWQLPEGARLPFRSAGGGDAPTQ